MGAMQFRYIDFWRFLAVFDCLLRLLAVQPKRKWVPKSMVNLWKLHQYHENGNHGRIGRPLRRQFARETLKGGVWHLDFSSFCRHLADFGRHCGPSWIPREVQKSCFWVSCWKNDEKRVSENETRKTSKFDRKFVPKWEGLGDENERFAGLQNKGFRGIVKY